MKTNRNVIIHVSHGKSCMYPNYCQMPKAITCDNYLKTCRCLQFNEIPIELDGKNLQMQWNSSADRCLAQQNSICTLEPVIIQDEFGVNHPAKLDCSENRKCEYKRNEHGFRFGICTSGAISYISVSLFGTFLIAFAMLRINVDKIIVLKNM